MPRSGRSKNSRARVLGYFDTEVVRQTLTCSWLPGPAVIGSKNAVQMAIFSRSGSSIPCERLLLGKIISWRSIPQSVARSVVYLIGIWHVVPRWSHLLSIICSIWFISCHSTVPCSLTDISDPRLSHDTTVWHDIHIRIIKHTELWLAVLGAGHVKVWWNTSLYGCFQKDGVRSYLHHSHQLQKTIPMEPMAHLRENAARTGHHMFQCGITCQCYATLYCLCNSLAYQWHQLQQFNYIEFYSCIVDYFEIVPRPRVQTCVDELLAWWNMCMSVYEFVYCLLSLSMYR